MKRSDKTGLHPYGANDVEAYGKLRFNTVYSCTVKQPRSPRFHRKYMGLCRMILKGNNNFPTAERVSDYLLMKCGYYDKIVVREDTDGQGNTKVETIIFPAHINFEAMDNLEFSAYFDKAVIVAADMLDCSVEDIDTNLVFEAA